MTGRRRRGRPVWPMLLAAGVVVGIVVAMALFVRGFDNTGSDNVAAPAASPAVTDAGAAPVPLPSRTGKRYVVPGGGPTITLGANGGPGLKINNNQHRLVAHVTSAAPIYAVGWLIPTSLNSSYGKDMHPGRSFTIDTTVTGRPYYSLLWVYAGRSGVPVTCTISIDGKVKSRKTTEGSYGRQVCYA